MSYYAQSPEQAAYRARLRQAYEDAHRGPLEAHRARLRQAYEDAHRVPLEAHRAELRKARRDWEEMQKRLAK